MPHPSAGSKLLKAPSWVRLSVPVWMELTLAVRIASAVQTVKSGTLLDQYALLTSIFKAANVWTSLDPTIHGLMLAIAQTTPITNFLWHWKISHLLDNNVVVMLESPTTDHVTAVLIKINRMPSSLIMVLAHLIQGLEVTALAWTINSRELCVIVLIQWNYSMLALIWIPQDVTVSMLLVLLLVTLIADVVFLLWLHQPILIVKETPITRLVSVTTPLMSLLDRTSRTVHVLPQKEIPLSTQPRSSCKPHLNATVSTSPLSCQMELCQDQLKTAHAAHRTRLYVLLINLRSKTALSLTSVSYLTGLNHGDGIAHAWEMILAFQLSSLSLKKIAHVTQLEAANVAWH